LGIIPPYSIAYKKKKKERKKWESEKEKIKRE
jgi:hypothetical protein